MGEGHLELTGGGAASWQAKAAGAHLELFGSAGGSAVRQVSRVAIERALQALPADEHTFVLPLPESSGAAYELLVAAFTAAALDIGVAIGRTQGASSISITRPSGDVRTTTTNEDVVQALKELTDAVGLSVEVELDAAERSVGLSLSDKMQALGLLLAALIYVLQARGR